MIEPERIMQTKMGGKGNCQSACIAMMLGLPLADVPDFAALYEDAADYRREMRDWFAMRGLQILTFGAAQDTPQIPVCGYCIVGGKTPRGLPHAVIFRNGEIWHDPHPDQSGLTEIVDFDLILPITGAFLPHRYPNEQTDV